jgi:hypothetical protein
MLTHCEEDAAHGAWSTNVSSVRMSDMRPLTQWRATSAHVRLASETLKEE